MMSQSEFSTATQEEIHTAREECQTEDLQIDDDALVSEVDGEAFVWVQAWVRITV